ncbi:MAG TPA: FliM/FliN family flagellar motor switch protein [Pyrinomonadaceae bacterium]|jgi:flagellar motor switch/type III secretory pathway protein FliN
MKTSEKTIAAGGEAEENFAPGDLSLDPFAVDIFGKESAVETEKTPDFSVAAPSVDLRISQSKRASWFAALPRVSRREAEFSNSFLELPDNLSASAAKKIEETIAYYTLRSPHSVKCAVISAAEVNLAEAVREAAKAPHVFLTLGCQPDNSRALIAINADFAASIINSVLIDDGTTVFAIRELSAIERTIIEFLGISVLGEVNNLLNQNLFCLQSVATEASEPFAANERGAEIVVSLNFGTFSGALSLFAARRFLTTLGAATRGGLSESASNKNVLQTLERFVPKLNLNALIGTTRLSGADLNYLEPDDIIIIDQPEIDWQSAAFQGSLQVYLGGGRNFRLSGNVSETGSDAELKLKIEEISVGEVRSAAPAAIRMQMNETENNLDETGTGERAPETGEQFAGENAEENPAALENVLVTLRVELGAGKISLREIQSLRAGQIISLGARPTDPVRVVTDAGDQPVATGELIEIEGQLGVRLTKIFI